MANNCYECKYRGNIPGYARSCCRYPGTSTDMFDFFNPANVEIAKKLHIQGNPHGIKFWPVNFDPVWLISCDGFKEVETKTNTIYPEEE